MKVVEVKQTSADHTRDRLLAAARDVISKKGKRGATTREIADAAGLNEATLFRHFGSKEALIMAVAQHYCGAVELRGVIESLSGDLQNDLFVIGETVMARMNSIRDFMRWSMVEEDLEESSFAMTTWRPHLAIYEIIAAYMERRVAAGELRGDPKQLALVFMGFIFAQVIGRKKFPIEQYYGTQGAALRFYVELFLDGVRG